MEIGFPELFKVEEKRISNTASTNFKYVSYQNKKIEEHASLREAPQSGEGVVLSFSHIQIYWTEYQCQATSTNEHERQTIL